jgi:hypothetical protein
VNLSALPSTDVAGIGVTKGGVNVTGADSANVAVICGTKGGVGVNESAPVMEYLIATHTLRRVGRRYVPRTRTVRHRGSPRSQSAHSLRILLGLLRNIEHNARPRRAGPSWPEFTADCPRFPVRLRAAFNNRAEKEALAMTRQKDAEMRRAESGRHPNEPTVPLSVNVYVFEGGRARGK